MQRLIAVILIFGFLISLVAISSENKLSAINIKYLYSKPSTSSKMIYSIPAEVKLLDISEDGNWYKVQITYSIGFFNYDYVGWTKIPVGQVLSEREKKPSEIAKAPVIDE